GFARDRRASAPSRGSLRRAELPRASSESAAAASRTRKPKGIQRACRSCGLRATTCCVSEGIWFAGGLTLNIGNHGRDSKASGNDSTGITRSPLGQPRRGGGNGRQPPLVKRLRGPPERALPFAR